MLAVLWKEKQKKEINNRAKLILISSHSVTGSNYDPRSMNNIILYIFYVWRKQGKVPHIQLGLRWRNVQYKEYKYYKKFCT